MLNNVHIIRLCFQEQNCQNIDIKVSERNIWSGQWNQFYDHVQTKIDHFSKNMRRHIFLKYYVVNVEF